MTADEFRDALKRLNLNQTQAALVLGFSRVATVSDMARGVQAVTPTTERLLAMYLAGHRPADWPAGDKLDAEKRI
jgi:hypothetical protein